MASPSPWLLPGGTVPKYSWPLALSHPDWWQMVRWREEHSWAQTPSFLPPPLGTLLQRKKYRDALRGQVVHPLRWSENLWILGVSIRKLTLAMHLGLTSKLAFTNKNKGDTVISYILANHWLGAQAGKAGRSFTGPLKVQQEAAGGSRGEFWWGGDWRDVRGGAKFRR